MNDNNNILEIKSQIQSVLPPLIAAYPEIKSAYLFGSTAQGIARSSSDVDIAIRCTPDLSPESYFNLRLKLIEAVEDALNRKTDIVILNTASLKMIRQVIRHGVLLYAENPENETDYAVQKQREYFDFKYYMDKDGKALKSFFGAV